MNFIFKTTYKDFAGNPDPCTYTALQEGDTYSVCSISSLEGSRDKYSVEFSEQEVDQKIADGEWMIVDKWEVRNVGVGK